jgi:alpha-galactosidase/6-phospho-beta-glucosidase family protein
MMQIIHQFCKSARCQPADIVIEWDTTTGARLTAKSPDGAKCTLNVLCGLNHMAQALLLAINGEEKRYPQMLEQQKQLDAKIRQWKAGADDTSESESSAFYSTTDDEVSTTDWRSAKNPAEVLQWFPARPKPDELIDLWQLNKKFASPQLANLLKRHTR